MKTIRMLAGLLLLSAAPLLAQGGVSSATPAPAASNASAAPAALTLYTQPTWCASGYIPASIDVAGNAVGCYALPTVTPAPGTVVSKETDVTASGSTVALDPTATLNMVTLASGITSSFTLAAPTTPTGNPTWTSQLIVCQPATGVVGVLTLPANVRGTIPALTVLGKCSAGTLTYSTKSGAWFLSGTTTLL